MGDRCYKCYKSVNNCLCKYTREIDAGIKFVFLMHPKEAKRQRTGTGNLAHISLIDSEIIVGLDFFENKRLQELLNDEKYFDNFSRHIGLCFLKECDKMCSLKEIRCTDGRCGVPQGNRIFD